MEPKQDGRVIRRDFDLNFDGTQLKAYTKEVEGKEVKFLGGTASSTAKDLYGDVISASGQAKMMEKLQALAAELKSQNSGLTGWLNHSYRLPEDTLGAFTDASIAVRSEGGEDFIDLDIECRVTETNPRAVAAWQQVKDGIRHGWSIGAYFLDAEWMSDDPSSPDYWSLYITDLNLIEISLVGIPANQRAWCKSAADMKAKAVEAAERIAKEAKAEGREPMALRQFVRRSFFEADGETRGATAPEIRSEGESAPAETPAEPAAQDAPAENPPAQDPAQDTAPADPVQSEAPKTADSNTTAPITASTEPQQPPEVKEATELSAALREAAGKDPKSVMLSQAADAIDALSHLLTASTKFAKRDPADGDGDMDSPDDYRDRISLAIGHLAKSVGHGLCMKGGSHVAKAIDCLAAAVVDQPGPEGDEDPDQLAAHVKKLSPKAGDWIVLTCENKTAEEMDQLRSQWESNEANKGLRLAVLPKEMTLTIDNDLAAKVQSLQEASSQLDAKASELAEIEQKLSASQAQLAEIEEKIKAAKETRLGRKSTDFADLAALRNAPVDASAMPKNEVERLAAIKKMITGEQTLTGRDMVANRS